MLPNLNEYLFSSILLLGLLIGYLKMAPRWEIVDNPNHRSSHTTPTIRGGGIIFLFAALLAFFLSDKSFPYLFVAILMGGLISFWDDISPLPPKVRLPFHFLSIGLVFFETNLPLSISTVFLFILAIGMLNAYNFMDGINGITGIYSLVTLSSIGYVLWPLEVVSPYWIILPIITCILFLFFNFRKKARCFLGDVGSISIALWILFLLGKLILTTGDYSYIFFLSIYGMDAGITLVQRLFNGEDITEPHRSHLYQYLTNPGSFSHRQVAAIFGFVQLFFNALVIGVSKSDMITKWGGLVLVIVNLVFFYLRLKKYFLDAVSKN